ncbi:hypothetical protein COE51_01555 [Bacillus pseudomycoides]|nr:hypothetical protein COE51_01555 [Bacillus pseudomycoides]
MLMKVERILTSKGLFYYSETGKTEAAIIEGNIKNCKIHKLNNMKPEEVLFSNYDCILIGTPTYGRGVPPLYFKQLLPKLYQLNGKRIGLFGSGNTIYGDDFCGALDLIEEIVKNKNEVIFKYKFEGMPKQENIKQLTKLIMEA